MTRSILLLLAFFWLALPAHAQTMLAVPLDRSSLAWDYPSADATHFLVTCNTVVTPTPDAKTSIPLSAVISGPGDYTCTVAAANEFGVSAQSNAVSFKAGYPPKDAPQNLRMEGR